MFDTISAIDNHLKEKSADISVLDRYIMEISGLWHTHTLV